MGRADGHPRRKHGPSAQGDMAAAGGWMPAPLAFHILGPLQVTHAAAPVAIGGARGRGRLAQALWGNPPPATARHQVAIGVSRLRKAFATAGAGREVIATVAPGYLV